MKTAGSTTDFRYSRDGKVKKYLMYIIRIIAVIKLIDVYTINIVYALYPNVSSE